MPMRIGHQLTLDHLGRLVQAVKTVGMGSGTIGNRTLNESPTSGMTMTEVAIGHRDPIGLQRLQTTMDGIRTGPQGRHGKTLGRTMHGTSGTPRLVLYHLDKGNLRENVMVAIKQKGMVIDMLTWKFSHCHRRQRFMMSNTAHLGRCPVECLRWLEMKASLHWHQGRVRQR